MAAVEVKVTERLPDTHFQVQKQVFRRLANSNIPVLLLVVDVKENRLFYALPEGGSETGASTVTIPLTEVGETTRGELRRVLATSQFAETAGAD